MATVRSARSLRAAVFLLILLAPGRCLAVGPGVLMLRDDSNQGSGVAICRVWYDDSEYHIVLTANHVMRKDTTTVDGASAVVVARDPSADLALVKVKLPTKHEIRRVAPPWFQPVGRSILHGFPDGSYEAQDCNVDGRGDLSCQVRGGGSGGPLLKDGYIVGVLIRYHGVATLQQIRAFLDRERFLPHFEPEPPVAFPAISEATLRKLDELDRALDNLERVIDESQRERERMLQIFLEDQARMHRRFFDGLPRD